jgi:hypothetical protein
VNVLPTLREQPDDASLRGGSWQTGTRRLASREGAGLGGGPSGPGDSPAETSRRLREWVERKELDRVVTLLAADCRFHTPATDRFELVGREQCHYLVSTIFQTVDFLRYHSDIGSGDRRVVALSGVVGGCAFEESKFLRFNDRNEISEIVFFIRPLSGLLTMTALVGPRLLRSNGHPLAAAVATPLFRLLAGSWRIADLAIAPLAGPTNAGRRAPSRATEQPLARPARSGARAS